MITMEHEKRRQTSEGLLPSFRRLYSELLQRNDFFKKGAVQEIPLGTNYLQEYRKHIAEGAKRLPRDYREAYIEPLCEKGNLAKIVTALTGGNSKFPSTAFQWLLEWNLTILLNAAMQPSQSGKVGEDVRGLWAVGSDIYRSFIPAWSRITNDPRMRNTLPPLMTFTYYTLRFSPTFSKPAAPCTIDIDYLTRLSRQLELGKRFKVGVVSMPSGFRNHPIFWGILAHEVAGHNVLHAGDDTLLDELSQKIRVTVRRTSAKVAPDHTGALEEVWNNWAEEAISDVCAVLNLGPFYGLGLLIYYTSMYHLWLHPKEHANIDEHTHRPLLENKVVKFSEGQYDLWVDSTHPVPILLPHLILGAVEELIGLDESVQARYMAQIKALSQECEGGQTMVDLSALKIEDRDHNPVDLNQPLPLKAMQTIAYEVGKCIASAPMDNALKGQSLRDLETWNNEDEEAAQDVATALENNAETLDGIKSKTGKDIDAAQFLAGGIFAAIRRRVEYDRIGQILRKALINSYDNDPLVQKL